MASQAMAIAAPVVVASLTAVNSVNSLERISFSLPIKYHRKSSQQLLLGGSGFGNSSQVHQGVHLHRICSSECSRGRSESRISASREDPAEILEDSKFVPLNDDDPRFGPSVLFLLGFANKEASKVQELLREMEGDFLKVVLCTKEMVKRTLGEAVNTQQPDISKVQVAQGLPGICFLSGLTGEEIMMLIQAFRDAGMKDTVFAAHVPKNTDKSLEELIEEIMGDHERVTRAKSSQV